MKYNVLFLDFDGPLTNARAYAAFDKPQGRVMWTTADPVAVTLLNDLYRQFRFLTVVSSTWRNISLLTPTNVDAKESLRLWGYVGEFHVDWATPRLGDRNREIRQWLMDHAFEVDNWASLDDMQLKKWTNNVRVHENDGMSYNNYLQLRNMLSGGGWKMDQLLKKAE